MARPLNIRFFEVPLPKDLPPNLEWLRLYHSNSEQLIRYLTDKGAGCTAYHSTLRCLTDLRTHLLVTEKKYSPEVAITWFEEKDTRDKGSRVTLDRLSDLFQFGTVQPLHAFPAEIPYRNELCVSWKNILDKYISSLLQNESWKKAIRSHVARFLYRIQQQGIINPEGITFEVLEDYLQNDSHISATSTSIYAHAIGKFIQYMADQQLCGHGLGWYPFFYLHGRVSNLTNLTTDQIERLEAARAESQEFPSEEFAAVIPDFVDRIISIGYSKTQRIVAKYSLLNLLLFLEMHDLGYHPVIASIWLEIEHNRINSSGWKQCRRILNLFEVYTVEGDIIPQLVFREKPLLSDGLPSWCKNRLDVFISQKTREGWEKSTICMYRSSITRFCLFLCSEGFSSFSDIDASTVAAFNRADKHLTAEGKNAYNVRIRSFLQFLERNQNIPYGLHLALYCKSANSEKIVMTLTDEELTDIRKAHTCSHTINAIIPAINIMHSTRQKTFLTLLITIGFLLLSKYLFPLKNKLPLALSKPSAISHVFPKPSLASFSFFVSIDYYFSVISNSHV